MKNPFEFLFKPTVQRLREDALYEAERMAEKCLSDGEHCMALANMYAAKVARLKAASPAALDVDALKKAAFSQGFDQAVEQAAEEKNAAEFSQPFRPIDLGVFEAMGLQKVSAPRFRAGAASKVAA